MISNPQISSPWMAAVNQTTGPSLLPCTTIKGRATGVPLIRLPMGNSMRMRFPALTLWPAISNGGRVVVRLARVVDFFLAVLFMAVVFLLAVALVDFFLVVGLALVLFLTAVSLVGLVAVDVLVDFFAVATLG